MAETSRRSVAGKPKKKGPPKKPPVFTQEFLIKNNGDFAVSVIMITIVGFIFKKTTPISYMLVAPQYNETFELTPGSGSQTYYRTGWKDLAVIFFYTDIWIAVHAALQEFVFDKLQRKLHLSKTKLCRFPESGQLAVFTIYSVIHAGYLLRELHVDSDLTALWVGYPEIHRHMFLCTKLFFTFQIAFWIHQFPELYFQRVRRADMRPRIIYSIIHLTFISAAYILNFTRLALALLFLEYISQTLIHIARLYHFAEKWDVAKTGFKVWNVVFVIIRLASAVLSVLTLWYGLRPSEIPEVDTASGNYNTRRIRLGSLACVLGLQLYMLRSFILFHVRRNRTKCNERLLQQQQSKKKKKK